MPSNKERKYQRVISYVEDQVGADVNRDLLKVAIGAQDISEVSVDLSKQSKNPLVVTDDGLLAINSLPDVTIGTWGAGTLATEQQTPLGVEDTGGVQIDPATEGSLSSELSREIGTWSAGVLSIQEDTPLDVSGATVSVQEDTPLDVSGTTVPTEQQTPLGVEDTGGVQIDPLNQADTTPLTGTATTAGTAGAIALDLGDLRTGVDFFYDVAVNGRLEIEVSTDGATWRSFQTVDTNDANVPQSDIVQFETAYRHTRVYANGTDFADADVNQLEASAKGVN